MDTVLNIRAQDLDHALVDALKEQFGNAQVEIRVYNIPEEAGMLSETGFWELIAQLDWSQQDKEKIDDFLYARCGVVAKGQIFYKEVLQNPETMPNDHTFSPLLRIAHKAYERKTGNKMTIPAAFNYETYSNSVGWE